MYDRTVSVYSAGKIFAATGVRSGWAIGSTKVIQSVRSVHTYNVFCYYNIVEAAIAKSLQKISDPNDTYMVDYAKKL
jgi:aspartate/methionine/tyrosine aminotransferase